MNGTRIHGAAPEATERVAGLETLRISAVKSIKPWSSLPGYKNAGVNHWMKFVMNLGSLWLTKSLYFPNGVDVNI